MRTSRTCPTCCSCPPRLAVAMAANRRVWAWRPSKPAECCERRSRGPWALAPEEGRCQQPGRRELFPRPAGGWTGCAGWLGAENPRAGCACNKGRAAVRRPGRAAVRRPGLSIVRAAVLRTCWLLCAKAELQCLFCVAAKCLDMVWDVSQKKIQKSQTPSRRRNLFPQHNS